MGCGGHGDFLGKARGSAGLGMWLGWDWAGVGMGPG
jgi:hypothetical protein